MHLQVVVVGLSTLDFNLNVEICRPWFKCGFPMCICTTWILLLLPAVYRVIHSCKGLSEHPRCLLFYLFFLFRWECVFNSLKCPWEFILKAFWMAPLTLSWSPVLVLRSEVLVWSTLRKDWDQLKTLQDLKANIQKCGANGIKTVKIDKELHAINNLFIYLF